MTEPEPPNKPLLSVRTTLVLLLAALSGVGAGLLAMANNHSAAESVMTGCGVAAAGLALFNQLIAGE